MAKIHVRNAHTATIYVATPTQPDPKHDGARRAVRDPVPLLPGAVGEVESENPSVVVYMTAGLLAPVASA